MSAGLRRFLRPVPVKWELSRAEWEALKKANQAKKRGKK